MISKFPSNGGGTQIIGRWHKFAIRLDALRGPLQLGSDNRISMLAVVPVF